MSEIVKKIKKEIEAITEQTKELEKITEISETSRIELKELEEKRNEIKDSNSGFYQDIEKQIKEKNTEFMQKNIERMSKSNEVNSIVLEKKREILEEIEKQKDFIDQNREIKVEEYNLDQLKSEKDKLEKQITLSKIMGGTEEYEKLSDSEKEEVKEAHGQVLNNQKRLKEIAPVIEILTFLDGEQPKDKFIKLSSMSDMVEKEFKLDGLQDLNEKLNKFETEKQIEKDPVEEEHTETIIDKEPENENEEKDNSPELSNRIIEETEKEINNNSVISPKNISKMEEKQSKQQRAKTNDILQISYSAKSDIYILKNKSKNEIRIENSDELEKIDKKILAQKLGKKESELINIDTKIFSLLYNYDKARAVEYFEMMTTLGKSPNQRKEEMIEKNLKIDYNLKGLYDKIKDTKYVNGRNVKSFTKEERNEILKIANNAKINGIAEVTKGAKVSIREMFDKIISKTKSVKLLSSPKKEEEYSKLANSDYLKTIEPQFNETIKNNRLNKSKIKNQPKIFKQKAVKLSHEVRNNMAKKVNSFADKLKVDDKTQKKLENVTEESKKPQSEKAINIEPLTK